MVGEFGAIGCAEFANGVSTVTRDRSDFVWAAEAVGKFGNTVFGCVALDRYTDHDDIADFEKLLVARFVHTLAMVGAAFFNNNLKNVGGEFGLSLG